MCLLSAVGFIYRSTLLRRAFDTSSAYFTRRRAAICFRFKYTYTYTKQGRSGTDLPQKIPDGSASSEGRFLLYRVLHWETEDRQRWVVGTKVLPITHVINNRDTWCLLNGFRSFVWIVITNHPVYFSEIWCSWARGMY